MTPIINYLTNNLFPDNETEAKRIRQQSFFYIIDNGEFFRCNFSSPLLKCLDETQVEYFLAELHHGICGVHSGGRCIVTRVLRVGYYQPTHSLKSAKIVRGSVLFILFLQKSYIRSSLRSHLQHIPQFIDKGLEQFLQQLNVKHQVSSV